jgi:uncharacterized repeat protein (TIGR01451 family)
VQLINDSFRFETVDNPNYLVGGSNWTPCLTASQDLNQRPIPGCPVNGPSLPTGGDPNGDGALRLTSNGNNSTGFVLYQDGLPLTAGLDVRFSFYAYNGSGADGFTFFIADGAVDLRTPGAFGGSLGYAQRSGVDGLRGGYVGIGVDEWGNYANNGEGRGQGCTDGAPTGGLFPDRISLRGPGSGQDRYCLLKTSAKVDDSLDFPGDKKRSEAIRRDVRITVDPLSQANGQITVYLDTGAGEKEILREPLPPNPPPTFKFGFGAATGGSTNIHEIRTLNVESILPLPRLKLAKSNGGPYVTGSSGLFTLSPSTERGTGVGPVTSDITITDTLPAGTITAVPSGEGWNCAATVVGSSTLSCTRPASPSAPIAEGTTLPTISFPVAWDLQTSGKFTNVAEIDSADNANSPEQSRARNDYTVMPLGADDSATTSVGVPVAIDPLANDHGSLVPKTFRAARPGHGRVLWNAANAKAVYIPDPGFSGIDKFTYTVRDGSGQQIEQTVTITVTPEASDDATTTPFQTPVDLDVLENDRGTLQPGSVTIVTPTSNGSLAVDPRTGIVTYTPNAGFTGRDMFRYRAVDGAGQAVEANGTIDVGPPAPQPEPEPGEPDLVVNKTTDRTIARVGDLITYRLVVENRGNGPAEDVVLVDTPILRADLESVEVSQGTCVRGTPNICDLGTIRAGDRVTINAGLRARQPGLLTNGVVVTETLPEPRTGNNADVAGVRVVDRSARVTISKRASRSRVRAGGKVRFDITVTSRGPATARRLLICDRLPRGLQVVHAPVARVHGKRVCWRARSAAPGRRLRYQVVARAGFGGSRPFHVNRVLVRGPNFGPRLAAARVGLQGRPSACPASGGPVARASC